MTAENNSECPCIGNGAPREFKPGVLRLALDRPATRTLHTTRPAMRHTRAFECMKTTAIRIQEVDIKDKLP